MDHVLAQFSEMYDDALRSGDASELKHHALDVMGIAEYEEEPEFIDVPTDLQPIVNARAGSVAGVLKIPVRKTVSLHLRASADNTNDAQVLKALHDICSVDGPRCNHPLLRIDQTSTGPSSIVIKAENRQKEIQCCLSVAITRVEPDGQEVCARCRSPPEWESTGHLKCKCLGDHINIVEPAGCALHLPPSTGDKRANKKIEHITWKFQINEATLHSGEAFIRTRLVFTLKDFQDTYCVFLDPVKVCITSKND